MSEVRVLLFARARELAGLATVCVTIPESATVADVRRAVAERVPSLAPWLPRCAIGVNGEYVGDNVVIPAGAEIAVIPPLSGG
jgi:molybdopterin converting factor subunit 1